MVRMQSSWNFIKLLKRVNIGRDPLKENSNPIYSSKHMYTLSFNSSQFSSVQSLSCVWLFATPWIAARQASLSITNSRSSLRFTSIKSMMPSSHLILCCPLLLLPPIPPSIRVFSNRETNNNKNKNRESKHLIGMLEREKRIRQKKYLKR